ncbi:MAG: PTS sugar transporter subunit IIA [Anaerohalosphaeraceae bacterium]|nr:PTS sugar transporter subunit IIA [Anaerohalosphaeraceae bacterium]
MNIAEVVCSKAIVAKLESVERDDVITQLAGALVEAGAIPKTKRTEIVGAVIERENEASTGIGKGVAVPHIKHKSIKNAVAAIGISQGGIDFSSLDKQPVYTVILLVSPTESQQHLEAMETIFERLQNDNFRKFLAQSKSVEQIEELLKEIDENPSL